MSHVVSKLLKNYRVHIVIVFLVFFVFGAATAIIVNKNKETVDSPISDIPAPSLEPFVPLEDIENIDSFNVLLLGYGGAGHDGGYLTDVIMLVHFDFEKKTIGMISIPRDLWVKLPSGKETKINAAFITDDAPQYPLGDVSLEEALSGAEKTKSVIETVTGLEPHFFVGVDFMRFVSIVDTLGGITVDVPEGFSDPWYPIKGRELELCGMSSEEIVEVHEKYSGFELEKQFDCRYEKLSFKKGEVEMNGNTALKFVRSRHSSTQGGDFARSLRQQAVLVGLRDRLLSKKALKNPLKLYEDFSKSIQTNLNENLIKNLVPLLSNIGKYRVVNIGLSDANVLQNSKSSRGAFILVPKSGSWNSIHTYISSELEKE